MFFLDWSIILNAVSISGNRYTLVHVGFLRISSSANFSSMSSSIEFFGLLNMDFLLKKKKAKVRESQAEKIGREKRTWTVERQFMVPSPRNAFAHASLLIRHFCAKTKMIVLLQPPCSQYLALADFFSFFKTEIHEGLKDSTLGEKNSQTDLRAKNVYQRVQLFPKNPGTAFKRHWK